MYLLLQHCSIIKKAFFHTNQNKEICSQSLSLRYKWLRSYIFMSIRSMHCELSPFWITYISYVGLKIVGWCWTKWSPTFTAKYIYKFVLPIDPIHVYPALVGVIMIVCWASLRSAPTYTKWSPTFTAKRIWKFFTERPNPCLSRSGWLNNAQLLGFAALCTCLQKPRYRPWISASSLLVFNWGFALVWLIADSDETLPRTTMLPNGVGVGSGRGWFYGQDQ